MTLGRDKKAIFCNHGGAKKQNHNTDIELQSMLGGESITF